MLLTRKLGLKHFQFVAKHVKLNAPRQRISASSQVSLSSAAREPNDPYMLRHQNPVDKSSNQKWLIKRVGSLAIGGCLIGCGVIPGNAVLDFATVTLLAHHCYTGMGSIFADYCPLFLSDTMVHAVLTGNLFFWIIVLGLLFSFNYNDVGFSNALVAIAKL